MKTAFVIAASAAVIAAALPAAAQPMLRHDGQIAQAASLIHVADRDRERGPGRSNGRWRGENADRGPDRRAERGRARGDDQAPRAAPGRNWSPPPPARGRAWGRGDFLPPGYRGSEVRDFGRYRLRPPPAGYDWVQVGPDIYLTQRSTGMVLEAIPGGY